MRYVLSVAGIPIPVKGLRVTVSGHALKCLESPSSHDLRKVRGSNSHELSLINGFKPHKHANLATFRASRVMESNHR